MASTEADDVSRARFEHVYRDIIKFPSEEAAADHVNDAVNNKSEAEVVNAIHAYAFTQPNFTYADLQKYFFNNGLDCHLSVVDPSEVSLNVQQTLMDLQGKTGKIFAIKINFLEPNTSRDEREHLRESVRPEQLQDAGHAVWLHQLPSPAGVNAPASPSSVAVGVGATSDDAKSNASTELSVLEMLHQLPSVAGVNAPRPSSTVLPALDPTSDDTESIGSSASLEAQVAGPIVSPTTRAAILNYRPTHNDGASPPESPAPTPTSASPDIAATQPVVATAPLAPSTTISSFPASFDVSAYNSAASVVPQQPVVQVNASLQTLPHVNNGWVVALPVGFDIDAYASAGANTTQQPVMKDRGGLLLPDIISFNSKLWACAKRALVQMIRFRDLGPEDNREGIVGVFPPPLEDWVGKDVIKRCRNATNHIYDAINPAGTVDKLNAEQIMHRIGLPSDHGGFPAPVRRRIAESLCHMLKHMMWAFDLVEMQKNHYKHFVPADRYRFARALGIVPRSNIPIEFDIIICGRKRGVWKGTLDQLSWDKGDQAKIPNKIQCYLLVEELFGEDQVDMRVNALKLDDIWVRRWFVREGYSRRARYNGALDRSSRLA